MSAVVSALRPAKATSTEPVYLSPAEVCDIIPGMTEKILENLRGAGRGPRYSKPSQKTVVYERGDVLAYLTATRVETRH